MVGRTIVVALDGSAHSEIAFKFFVDNVYREGDEAILVHCVEINIPAALGILPPTREQVKLMIDDLDERSKKMMDKMKELMEKHNISGTVLRVHGKPGEAIIRVSEERNAAMIVTGSRGHGILRRTFLGSVSDYVVHHSLVPVFVCKH